MIGSLNRLLTYLYSSYMACKNYEAALSFIRQTKRLFDQRFSGRWLHDVDNLFPHIEAEVRCLVLIGRPDDGAKVLQEFVGRIPSDEAKKLPDKVQQIRQRAKHLLQYWKFLTARFHFGGVPITEEFNLYQNLAVEKSGIWQLRMKSRKFVKDKE